MWIAVSKGHKILLAAHIDDFIISWTIAPATSLLERVDGTSDGAISNLPWL